MPQYISSEATKTELKAQLGKLIDSERSCTRCEVLTAENENTKKALEDAINLSHLLLSEVQKLS